MMWTVHEAAASIRAESVGANVAFDRVTTDSRSIQPGDLFVALKGEHFDGHAFAKQAIETGAVAVMVEQLPAGMDCPAIIVPDSRLGLGQLAAAWRKHAELPVVAVTGSNGKTTVKEMIGSILREQVGGDATKVLVTQGNLNNDIGMPLTLLALTSAHQYAVLEMGMNHPGEIAYLTGIAKPTVALVNNAQAAHLEGLKTVADVARAKGEIFQGLTDAGVAVINADDPHAGLWRELAGAHRVVDFGLQQGQVTGSCTLGVYGTDLELSLPAGKVPLVLQVPGMHNVRNALAAAAAAVALGIPVDVIAAGLHNFTGVKGRLQRKHGLHGATLIDDTYNANPASVSAAVAVLGAAQGRKLLVLGDMGELGSGAREFHAQVGEQARQAGIDMLFALGEMSVAATQAFGKGGRHFETIQDMLAEIENTLAPDVTVLVKGSRFMQMERVVKSFEVKG